MPDTPPRAVEEMSAARYLTALPPAFFASPAPVRLAASDATLMSTLNPAALCSAVMKFLPIYLAT